MAREFTLKEGHLKLLQEMWVNWDLDCYFGSPCIDPKRPYGNSDVLIDVAKIVGIPLQDDDGSRYLEDSDHTLAEKWHEETAIALWIVIQNAGNAVPLGIWEQHDYFKWVYIGPEKEGS